MKLLVALAFLAGHFYVYHHYATDEVFPERRPFLEFPLALGEWECAGREELRPRGGHGLGLLAQRVDVLYGAAGSREIEPRLQEWAKAAEQDETRGSGLSRSTRLHICFAQEGAGRKVDSISGSGKMILCSPSWTWK